MQITEKTDKKRASARWFDEPMGYADSHGWFWGLDSQCQTVCGGKTEDILKAYEEAQESNTMPSKTQ